MGRITTLTVDVLGDLTQMTTPELCITGLVYNVAHQLVAYIEPAAGRTTYTYDGSDYIQSVTDSVGRITTLTFSMGRAI